MKRASSHPPQARLYDRLFTIEEPAACDEWLEHFNPRSVEVVKGALAGPSLAALKPGDRVQLERLGYFCVDSVRWTDGTALVL